LGQKGSRSDAWTPEPPAVVHTAVWCSVGQVSPCAPSEIAEVYDAFGEREWERHETKNVEFSEE
jgi:hypothetical protein